MLYAIFNLFGGLIGLVLILLVIAALTGNVFFVVKQQHAVIIERLGKFHRIVGAGFHAKIPFIDRKAATVSLRTMKNGFDIDVKTEDNVTIGLEVSAQYHVSYDMGSGPVDSGVYKSYYMLQQPVAQMRDFITDACAPPSPSIRWTRSSPRRTTSPRTSTPPSPSRWQPTASPWSPR